MQDLYVPSVWFCLSGLAKLQNKHSTSRCGDSLLPPERAGKVYSLDFNKEKICKAAILEALFKQDTIRSTID